jgi:HNH endonuclease
MTENSLQGANDSRKASSKKRFAVLTRDGFRCAYCGAEPSTTRLSADHIIPLSKGGADHVDNMITACFDCNFGKSDIVLPSAYAADLIATAKERNAEMAKPKVIIDGVGYASFAEAQRKFATNYYVIKHSSIIGTLTHITLDEFGKRYGTYSRSEKRVRGNRCSPITIRGVDYLSRAAACRALGIDASTLNQATRSGSSMERLGLGRAHRDLPTHIRWEKDRSKFAVFDCPGQQRVVRIGRFKTLDEAIKARARVVASRSS